MTAHAIDISPFWTIVWKEYRQSRGFWLAMVVLGLFGQLLDVWLNDSRALFSWAFGVAAFYAAGVGATMFAVEHEERTFEFLRRLPVGAGVLFVAKVTFAVLSIVGMQGVLSLTAGMLAAWQRVSPQQPSLVFGVWGLASIEGLVWGIACSMLIKWPLRAAFCALAGATISIQLAYRLVESNGRFFSEEAVFVAAVPYRIAIIAVVAALSIWLAPRWFGDRVFRPLFLLRRGSIAHSNVRHEELSFIWRGAFSSLIWQTWRQARWSLLLLIPLGALVIDYEAIPPLVATVATLCGSFVFRADQQLDSRRFLAQRGISAHTIWLSRQMVWLTLLILWTVLVIIMAAVYEKIYAKQHNPFSYVAYSTGFAATSYAASQLASLFIRSGILAGVAAFLLAGLVAAWAGLMIEMKINWLWSVWPIVITMFVVTWLRAPGWLLERNDLRSWVRPLTALVLPIATVVIAVAAYRVYQIPAVEPKFSPSATASKDDAAAQATLELYRRAWDLLQSTKWEAVRKSQVQSPNEPAIPLISEEIQKAQAQSTDEQVIALILEASQRDSCYLDFVTVRQVHDVASVSELALLLLTHGNSLESQGKLDAAFDSYLGVLRISRQLRSDIRGLYAGIELQNDAIQKINNWAGASNQTGERIDKALRQLELFHATLPAPSSTLEAEYNNYIRIVDNLTEAVSHGLIDAESVTGMMWVESSLPPERARAKRLINLLMVMQLDRWKRIEEEFAAGGNAGVLLDTPIDESHYYPNGWGAPNNDSTTTDRRSTTPLAPNINQTLMMSQVVSSETLFRATLTSLALESWYIKHGKLPKMLKELVGAELKQLLHDPCTGKPFFYYPEGVTILLRNRRLGEIVPPGMPFLWSPITANDHGFYIPFGIPDQLDLISDEILQDGWAFPIWLGQEKKEMQEPNNEETSATTDLLDPSPPDFRRPDFSPPGPSEE